MHSAGICLVGNIRDCALLVLCFSSCLFSTAVVSKKAKEVENGGGGGWGGGVRVLLFILEKKHQKEKKKKTEQNRTKFFQLTFLFLSSYLII
jgi:hypothetical protein